VVLTHVLTSFYAVAIVHQYRSKGLRLPVEATNIPGVFYTSSLLKTLDSSVSDDSSRFVRYECCSRLLVAK
jgi:hypothetical protein